MMRLEQDTRLDDAIATRDERVAARERDRILAILDELATDRGISRYSLAEVKRQIGGAA